jgi:acyl carrier protein
MDVQELKSWLVARVAKELKVPPERIDPDKELALQGVDSLLAVEIVADLEAVLGRALPPTLLWDHVTIGALAEYLSFPPVEAATM